jgi:hypothetical protein
MDTEAMEQRSIWLNATIEQLRETAASLPEGGTSQHITDTINGYLREQYKLTSDLATSRAINIRALKEEI